MHRKANCIALARIVGMALVSFAVSTRAAEEAQSAADAPTVEEILTSTPTDESYERDQKCVHSSAISRTEILSDKLIVLHLRRDQKLLLQFPQRCPGLRRNVTLRYEKGGTRICEHDTVQAMIELGTVVRWGPRCILPAFEPVTAAQVDYLKAELRSGPRTSAPDPAASEASEPGS